MPGYAGMSTDSPEVIGTVVLFVPLGWRFSRFGLNYFRLTFPVTEVITTTVGISFYRSFLRRQENCL